MDDYWMKHIALYSSSPQQGKSTVAKFLASEYGYQSISFASALLDMVETFLMHHGLSMESIDYYCRRAKEEVIPGIGKSYRYLARTLGTEWGRNLVGETVWIDAFRQKFERHSLRHPVCVDDLRFANELSLLRELGFTFVKITRNTDRDRLQDSHASDVDLINFADWDHVIDNNGTMKNLRDQVRSIIK